MRTILEKQISRATRKKMARVAKRTQKKRQMAKKRMAKRVKNPKQLRSLAQKQAKAILVKKLTGGKRYSDLPITAKEKIEKKLSKKPGLINRIAKKLLPKVKAKEKKRLAKVRAQSKPAPLNEVIDPLTIVSVVAATGGAVAISTVLAKKFAKFLLNRDVDFNVAKTYDLIKKKYPGILKMIDDQKFGRGRLAKMIDDMEEEIPDLKSKKILYNTTSIIDQLMKYHIWATIGTINPKLDPARFKNESSDDKHGVLTLSVNGSQPEVSARYVNGKLEPYVFKSRDDAAKHTDIVGGKPFESMDTGVFYVEFTKLDGPVNEGGAGDTEIKNPETGRNIKVSSALAYGKDEPVYKKALSIMSKAKDAVKNKIPKKKAIKAGIKDFFSKVSTEKDETVQSMKILSKYATGKKVSDEEKDYVADQFKDVLKIAGMGAVAAAPGGSIAVPLLVKAAKKMNVDLMPSAFQKENIVNEYVGPKYKTANEIKKHWKNEYPKDKFTFKKVRAKGNDWLLVLSPKGVELERYQHVPKTGWIEMNENKDNEEDLKSLKSMLDIAQLLSVQSPYFKGRGSKKEYIKMLLHKIKKLSENHEHFLEIIKVPIELGDTVLGGKFKNKKIVVKKIGKNEKGDLTINGKPLLKFRTIPQKGQMFKETSKKKKPISKMDAYKQVRKTTMPKSRPMKSKKAYDRKDYKKGKYD